METSHLRADFGQRAVVAAPSAGDWLPSPLPGVTRHMLDCIGGEAARVTSVVRYVPGSSFQRHVPFTSDEGALIHVKVGHLGAELLEPA